MLDIEIINADLRNRLGANQVNSTLVSDGVNKSFHVTSDQGNFFLRLSPPELHPATDVIFETQLLDQISEQCAGLAATAFFESEKIGLEYLWNEKKYFGLATHVAPGNKFSGSVADIEKFGRALGELHSIPVPELAQSVGLRLRREEGIAPSHLAGKLEPAQRMLGTAITSWLDRNSAPTYTSSSICHGDAWPGNANYSDGRATLFDFEHASVGDRLYDIATLAWWLFNGPRTEGDIRNTWARFLRAYSTSAAIPDLTQLPYYVMLNELRSVRFLDQFTVLPDDAYGLVIEGSCHLIDVWQQKNWSSFGNEDIPGLS